MVFHSTLGNVSFTFFILQLLVHMQARIRIRRIILLQAKWDLHLSVPSGSYCWDWDHILDHSQSQSRMNLDHVARQQLFIVILGERRSITVVFVLVVLLCILMLVI